MKDLLHDRVLILPDEDITQIAGFELPEGQKVYTGKVVLTGSGVPLHNVRLDIKGDSTPETLAALKEIVMLLKEGRPMRVKEGDHIMYGQYAGTRIALNGVPYVLVRESDIFGIL